MYSYINTAQLYCSSVPAVVNLMNKFMFHKYSAGDHDHTVMHNSKLYLHLTYKNEAAHF